MLENPVFKETVSWDNSGTSFLIKDINDFTKIILPQHFKHCNFASFVRQLNKYDFHKIRNNKQNQVKDGLNPSSPPFFLYAHLAVGLAI